MARRMRDHRVDRDVRDAGCDRREAASVLTTVTGGSAQNCAAIARREWCLDDFPHWVSRTVSIPRGSMPSALNPGHTEEVTLSIFISSTWFRVMGGRGKSSAI